MNLHRATTSWLPLLCLLALLPAAARGKNGNGCRTVKLQVERLADLNVPRNGHTVFCTGNEVVTIGGHTTGFVPTPTAEYYSQGRWYLLNSVYEHDAPMAVKLRSGKILIAGGFEKHLGIGQTFTAELYNPAQHSFDCTSCLDKKRAQANGVELGNGQTVIAGNWYADDGIEIFDGHNSFSAHTKQPSQQRTTPYVLRTAKDDAIIFGSTDPHDHPLDTILIDRLKGATYQSALFEQWRPMYIARPYDSQHSFVGDERRELYAYLFPVTDANGQVAIARTHGTDISLLPTDGDIPMTTPWGKRINYYTPVIADRQAGRGYIVGKDSCLADGSCRLYVACIDYAKDGVPAPITLYYTDPHPQLGATIPVLTADGNLMLVGGADGKSSTNFHPSGAVFLLRFSTPADARWQTAGWALAGVLTVLMLLTVLWSYRRDRHVRRQEAANQPPGTDTSPDRSSEELMNRISTLMEEQQMFLRSDLKITDLADALGVHRNQIARCLSSQQGCSFPQFVTNYRIAYAKRLLRQRPDEKMAVIGTESGFANEATFFRVFKAQTGMTPTAWKTTND